MNQKSQSCSHCGKALVKNNNSTICRSCRFNGHKEFGECRICLPVTISKNNPSAEKMNYLPDFIKMTAK